MACDVSAEIHTNHSVSEFSCSELCDDNTACLYFSFNSSSQQCVMYETCSVTMDPSAGQLYQKMGMQSYQALLKCFDLSFLM